jgi:hypothetical protein
MASDLISEVVNHVEFLGYTVKSEDEGNYIADPSSRDIAQPSFTFHRTRGTGVFFLCGFPISDKVKEDPTGFLQFVNEANLFAFVARFTWSPENEGFYAEAYYTSNYDKRTFGNFISTWLSEITSFVTSHKTQVKKYLKTGEEE